MHGNNLNVNRCRFEDLCKALSEMRKANVCQSLSLCDKAQGMAFVCAMPESEVPDDDKSRREVRNAL